MTYSGRPPRPGAAAPGRSARSYGVVFAVALAVLVLGLFGVLSICRDAVARSATRAVETARAQPPAAVSPPSFPPPIEPSATPTAMGSRPAAASPNPSPAPGSPGGRVHVVQAGDSLYRIAQQYDVSLDALMRANNLTPDSVLQIGQRIQIP